LLRSYYNQARDEEGKECTITRAPNHYVGVELLRGALKCLNYVTSTFFNTLHLLPKKLRFEDGGAKLQSCPGRHLTAVRP